MFLRRADVVHAALQAPARRPQACVASDSAVRGRNESDMTTFAALQDAERELEARTRAAWTTYGGELRGLDRSAYDDAEPAAWQRLQVTLRELDELRASAAPADAG